MENMDIAVGEKQCPPLVNVSGGVPLIVKEVLFL